MQAAQQFAALGVEINRPNAVDHVVGAELAVTDLDAHQHASPRTDIVEQLGFASRKWRIGGSSRLLTGCRKRNGY